MTSGVRPADATVVMARRVEERPVASGVDPGTSVAGRVTRVAALVTTAVAGPAMSVAALVTTVEGAMGTGTAAVIAAARRPRASGFAAAPLGCPRRRPVVRSRPSGRA